MLCVRTCPKCFPRMNPQVYCSVHQSSHPPSRPRKLRLREIMKVVQGTQLFGLAYLHEAFPDLFCTPVSLHLAPPCHANSSVPRVPPTMPAPGQEPRWCCWPHISLGSFSAVETAGPPWGHTQWDVPWGTQLILTTALGKRQLCPLFSSLGGKCVCAREYMHM